MVAADRVSAPLRILNLALSLINSRNGKTLTELVQSVPGYQHATPDSARRTFERDVAALREAGLVVDASSGEHPRYRVVNSEFGGEGLHLSEVEAKLLTRAASAWGEEDALKLTLLNKLRGYAAGPLPSDASPVSYVLEGGENVEVLVSAILARQAVEFEYASKSEVSMRSVAPWRIVTRGRWFYLWGFDLDRWAPRLFRLSRMLTPPQPIGEPGDAAPEGPLAEVPFDQSAFLVAPTFWAIPERAAHCVNLARSTGTKRGDWELFAGRDADSSTWENYLLREVDAVVVVQPRWLAKQVARHLSLAAQWGRADG